MPFSSSYISATIAAQQAQMAGQMAYSQQLSYPMQQALYPGMAPPPPMMPQAPQAPPMTAFSAAQTGYGGMYGEQMAMRMATAGQMAGGIGSALGGIGMGLAGLDPLSMGMRGFAAGGMMGGMAMAGAVALPMYAAGQVAQHYGAAFTGGMTDQASLNSTLRNNFQFHGGQGTMGRGFSQQQMGQVGSVIQNELNRNVFSNVSEMNSLISGGADAGMFTGVRDVQQFTQRFRRMLDTLKTVQDELGGTLTDALTFVRQSRQAGIFQQVDRTSFAGELRGAEATTGMSREHLMGLATQGAGISRAVGGHGRQGAFGALRTASQLGAAVQSGAINEEALSEATGGLTGADAMAAFTGRIMEHSARFSRRGMGRFSMYAMSNADGTGVDSDMMARFNAGDLSVSDVSRAAHRNVGQMGRARAVNQEGVLRGAMLEQGGLAAQIGMMRLAIGDRVLDQGDDRAQLFMQRRFRMSRPESEIMTSLMRNQASIAEQQGFDTMSARREQHLRTDVAENRSLDAFQRHLSHSVQEATGTLQTRELGRKFVSRISDMAERVMNDVLGISENRVSAGDQQALNRLSMGRAGGGDMERLNLGALRGGAASMTGGSLFGRSLFAHGASPGDILQRRGVRDVSGLSGGEVQEEVAAAQASRGGEVILERDRRILQRLEADSDRTLSRIHRAQLIAAGQGNIGNFYGYMGKGEMSGNATDAFLARNEMQQFGDNIGPGSLMRRGGGQLTGGMAMRDLARLSNPIGLAMAAYGQLSGSNVGLESTMALTRGEDVAAQYFASGGDLAAGLRRGGATSRGLAERNGLANGIQRGLRLFDPLSALSRLAPDGSSIQRALNPQLRQAGSEQNLLLEGLESVDREAMQAVLGGEGMRGRLGRILGAEGNGELMRGEIANLERYAGREFSDERQAVAARSLVAQIRAGVDENGNFRTTSEKNAGKAANRGSRLRAMLQAGSVDEERLQQMRDQMTEIGGEYSMLGRAVGGEMGERFGAIGSQFMQFEDASDSINSLRFDMARMDPNSQEYRDMARRMGQSDRGRMFAGGVAADRQRDRNLAGRGRRGRADRAATGLDLITGGTLGDMELTVGGRDIGQRNRASRVEEMLRRGGDRGNEIANQMVAQLEAAGVSNARDVVGDYRSSISDNNLDATERRNLIVGAGSNQQLQEVRQRAMEERQRQQNPLDTTRNELLTRIADGVGEMARRAGGEATGEAE